MRFSTGIILLVLSFLFFSSAVVPLQAKTSSQVDESRSFDATIVAQGYTRGARGARNCRNNELIDLGDGNFGNQVQVGHTYHFENAWIYEGNPGQLFFLWSNSRGFRYWEISGCPSAAPAQVSFSVDQNNLMQGQCALLRWDVDNVRAVYLDGQGVSGHDSRRVCPQATTTYTLRATTNSGDINRTVTVNIQIPPPAVEFSADRTTIRLGECTTLRWALAYVQSMSLDGATISNPGTKQVCPTATTPYTLRATSSSGNINRTITITVEIPAPSLDFRSDRSSIPQGECVTLSWTAANVQTLTLDGTTLNSTSGSIKDCPMQSKTYTLKATSRGGDMSRSVSVQVTEPPPVIDFKVVPSSLYQGKCAVLSWLAANTHRAYLNGEELTNAWLGSKEVCPSTTTTYEFKAVNASGERTQSVTLTVLAGPTIPTPDTVQYNIFDEGECTWWAFRRRAETGHPMPIVTGEAGKWDARNWADNARALGLPVDQNPAVGDVVVWPANAFAPSADPKFPGQGENHLLQMSGDAGHVAYVEGVEVHYEVQDGRPVPMGYVIQISESNGQCGWHTRCTLAMWVTTDAQFIH